MQVEVAGQRVTLVSANYRLPVTVGSVQIDCPITGGYRQNSTKDTAGRDPWGLDKDAISLWTDRAAATTTASHAYSTRVFRAAPIDFLRLEVQVEHHLEPDAYVLDILFSWDTHL